MGDGRRWLWTDRRRTKSALETKRALRRCFALVSSFSVYLHIQSICSCWLAGLLGYPCPTNECGALVFVRSSYRCLSTSLYIYMHQTINQSIVKPVAMSSRLSTSCSAVASSSLDSYVGRSSLRVVCLGIWLNRLRVRLQTESSKHQPMRYGYALVEAGVGARVAQVLTARALDVEAPEVPVV